MQLRGFGVKVSAMGALPSNAELAPFSRSGVDPDADIVDSGTSDMMTPIPKTRQLKVTASRPILSWYTHIWVENTESCASAELSPSQACYIALGSICG